MKYIIVISTHPVSKIITNAYSLGLCFTSMQLHTLTMMTTIGDSFCCKYKHEKTTVLLDATLVLIYINSSLFYRFERYVASDGQTHYAVAGYTTVYQYYAYPVST